MKIEIDQSGKVEYTAQKTVIADSLGNFIKISSTEKQTLLQIYRKHSIPRNYTLALFSALISILIKNSYSKNVIYIIDKEYIGREAEIRGLIMLFCKRIDIQITKEQITFSLVGKKSKAHEYAYLEFSSGNQKRIIKNKQCTVDYKDILKLTQIKNQDC